MDVPVSVISNVLSENTDTNPVFPNVVRIFQKTGKRLFFTWTNEKSDNYVTFLDFCCLKTTVMLFTKFFKYYEQTDDRNELEITDHEVVVKIFRRFGYIPFGMFSDIQKQYLHETLQKKFGIDLPMRLVSPYINKFPIRLLEYKKKHDNYIVFIYKIENGNIFLETEYFVGLDHNALIDITMSCYSSPCILEITVETIDTLLDEQVVTVPQILEKAKYRRKQVGTLLGICKLRKSSVFSILQKDIVKIIAKMCHHTQLY
ncbi:hypothetical protein Indivirus_7_11 [Indivirus ILV1]|uniref:Uncharacterized protein n=1 Tax=Indivirus ILV1 TaxID=1977633 RepID=A0A1V0SE50_9VIRU|nr:hypothetical protein Indivirus_7_11 [Indivirus ILV1]